MKTLLLLMTMGSLLLQGCTYAISRDLIDQADRTITFEMLQEDPVQYKGKIVILGGSIREVTDLAAGTLLTIDDEPLDHWEKPLRRPSGGRFLIYSPAYLDHTKYVPGRLVTVAGEVNGNTLVIPAAGKERKYPHPVLLSREIKLWPRARSPQEPEWIDPLYNRMDPVQQRQ